MAGDTMVKEYKSLTEYQMDAAVMAPQGWRVVSVVQSSQLSTPVKPRAHALVP
jgi:hypothetical protein